MQLRVHNEKALGLTVCSSTASEGVTEKFAR